MNTMLDISGSVIIGGLLILSLLALVYAVSDAQLSLGRSLAVQNQSSMLEDVITADLLSAGYAVPDSLSAIVAADTNRIVFLADVNGDAAFDTISYYASQTTGSNGEEINTVNRLLSSDPGNPWVFRFSTIDFTFYDRHGIETDSVSAVVSVEVVLKTGDSAQYNSGNAMAILQWRTYLTNAQKIQ